MWDLQPGPVGVRVTSSVDAESIAEQTVVAIVPVLPPRLNVTTADGRLTVKGLVQGKRVHLAVLSGDRAIATSPSNTLDLPRPAGPVSVRMLLADDTLAANVDVPAEPTLPSSAIWPATAAAAIAILGTAGFMVLSRLRRRQLRRAPTVIRPQVHHGHSAERLWNERRAGHFTVTTPGGDARAYAVHEQPLLIGSTPSCEVVIPDPAISPRHAQVSLSPDGRLRLLRLETGNADSGSPWTLLDAGDTVAIGAYVLRSAP